MTDKIKSQTEALQRQLKKVDSAKTKEEYIQELEKYNQMLKGADFSIESHEASNKNRKWYDKLAPVVNKVNEKLETCNRERGSK